MLGGGGLWIICLKGRRIERLPFILFFGGGVSEKFSGFENNLKIVFFSS